MPGRLLWTRLQAAVWMLAGSSLQPSQWQLCLSQEENGPNLWGDGLASSIAKDAQFFRRWIESLLQLLMVFRHNPDGKIHSPWSPSDMEHQEGKRWHLQFSTPVPNPPAQPANFLSLKDTLQKEKRKKKRKRVFIQHPNHSNIWTNKGRFLENLCKAVFEFGRDNCFVLQVGLHWNSHTYSLETPVPLSSWILFRNG